MIKFTEDELNVICIYQTKNKKQLISDMINSLIFIEDNELKKITKSAIDKLELMTDLEFLLYDFSSFITASE